MLPAAIVWFSYLRTLAAPVNCRADWTLQVCWARQTASAASATTPLGIETMPSPDSLAATASEPIWSSA